MAFKGYKQTKEHIRKKAEGLKKAHAEGRHNGGFKYRPFTTGFLHKKHTEEFKKQQSENKKVNNPMFNIEARKKVSNSRMGDKNPMWKGGISYLDRDPRYTFEYKEWRRNVFKRDNYTCKECGAKSSKGKYTYLTAHHIKEFGKHPKLRHDVNNGITLCLQCHSQRTGHEMLKNCKGHRLCQKSN